MTPKFFATAGYTFTKEESGTAGDSLSRHQAFVGPRYEYADKSFIFAQGGVILTKYSTGQGTTDPFWSAGITHTFQTVTASLNSSEAYSEDPLGVATLEMSYGASITKNFTRGTVTLMGSYDRYSDAISDHLNTEVYTTGLSGTYELLQDLHGTLGLTYQYYNYPLLDANTTEYSVVGSLSYLIAKETTIGFTYRHYDYSSAKVAEDNRQVNWMILEARKNF
jgi:uncharacterized protein (PEP-CTERM system associated)